MSARWSPAARDDLVHAVEYLAEASPDAAEPFVDAVERAVDLLLDGRFDGPSVRLASGEEVRVWSVGTYRLYYRRREGLLEVVRLYHARRRSLER